MYLLLTFVIVSLAKVYKNIKPAKLFEQKVLFLWILLYLCCINEPK